MAEQPQNAVPDSPKAKKSKLIVLLPLAIAILLGGSGAAWYLAARGRKPTTSAAKAEKKSPEYTVRLDSFTVNLNDQDESHFLRTTIELSLASAPKGDPSGKEGGDGPSSFPVARTRDTVLSVLTAAKANDLLTPEGKAALKQNLLTAVQQRVPEIEAKDVYFTEFLVQR